MEANKRIILNTSVQYIKAIVTTILSLFSMRIVLEAIGVSDYGIFSVVGGVIAMLGFITNALVITTQRYVSYYYGRHRTSQVKRFFTNSLFLHIILGLLIGLALLAIKGLLMNDFLKIDPTASMWRSLSMTSRWRYFLSPSSPLLSKHSS